MKLAGKSCGHTQCLNAVLANPGRMQLRRHRDYVICPIIIKLFVEYCTPVPFAVSAPSRLEEPA
jgi:hypothetical protein